MKSAHFKLYGSGDPNTTAMMQAFVDKNIAFEFLDIRRRNVEGFLESLAFLNNKGLHTVPQVFKDDGTHVGSFEATAALLATFPDPVATLRTA